MKSPNPQSLGAIIEMTEQLLEAAKAEIAAGRDRDGNPVTQKHFAAANRASQLLQNTREAAARGDITID